VDVAITTVMRSLGPPTGRLRASRSAARFACLAIGFVVLSGSTPAWPQSAPAGVGILVLKEHGAGSPTLAQPYLDRFVAIAAEQNGWPAARGQYYTIRAGAETFIETEKPHYGILSLPAFLALRSKYGLEVIGQVSVALVGGRQYHVVSTSQASLVACKGKTLASDHTDDARFIETVVAADAFKLTDFHLVQTQRPLQTIKKLLSGEAACALIDDAQLSELSHIEGAGTVRSLWKSAELPPMTVVAFPAAPAAEKKRFREGLSHVCGKDGQSVCAEVGIVSLKMADASDYAAVVDAYGK
jgi:hypothetical protein